jgi:hypothetical protein
MNSVIFKNKIQALEADCWNSNKSAFSFLGEKRKSRRG